MSLRAAGPLVALAAFAAVAACARPSTPPGGEQDRVPPRVLSVSPAPFDTLEDLRAPVVIEFDERLSIRLEGVTEWRDAVLVSPATGDVRVERGRRSLEISIAGGWREGLVYRVVVLPVYRDLFGNARAEPVELVFTTGAPIPPTAVAGFLEDRLTGLPVPGGRVEAVRRVDSVVYVAVSDTGGFFSLRHIPAGVYDVRGWLDPDRDRRMEFQEPQDTAFMPLGFQDTVVLPMSLLPRDTTPARLARAEPIDSQRVRLFFDDYFPADTVEGSARIIVLPDSVVVGGGRLIHPAALDSILAVERAAADSARAAQDTLAATPVDTAASPADTTAAPPGQAARPRPGAQRPTGRSTPGASARRLPSQELVLVLPVPLRPETPYVVEARGLINIRGVPGGGGAVSFRTPPRPTAEVPAPGGVPPDSLAPAPPDSLRP